MVRFPVEPLIRLARRSILSLSKSMGTEWANIHRALRDGATWAEADRWSVACGYHPASVWGRAWFAAVDPDDA